MTNKEALVAVVQVSVDDNVLEKALLDQTITSSETYAAIKSSNINKAAIDVLEGLLSRADVSEGGFSEKFDRSAIEKRLNRLYEKEGLTSTSQAVIIDRSNRW
jgi:hypothetical protein